MVKRSENLTHVMKPNMKGGIGTVEVINSADKGEYDSPANVIARLVIRPGVELGYHQHVEDEEIITILSGTANYKDESGEYILHPGDVTICRQGEYHKIGNDESSEEDLIVFAVVNKVL